MIYDYTLTTYPDQTNILLIGSLESILHLTRNKENVTKPIQQGQEIIFPTQAIDISRKHGFITQKGSDIRYTHLSKSGAQTWILSEYHQDLDNAPELITAESGNTPELLKHGDKLLIGGNIHKTTLDDAFTSGGRYQYALSFTQATRPFFDRLTQDLLYVKHQIARIEEDNTLNDCLEQSGWCSQNKPRNYGYGTSIQRKGEIKNKDNIRSLYGLMHLQKRIIEYALEHGNVNPKLLYVDHPNEFVKEHYHYFTPAPYIIQLAFEHPSAQEQLKKEPTTRPRNYPPAAHVPRPISPFKK